MGIKERLETGLASALDLSQRRLAAQEIAEEDRIPLFKPFEGLRIVLLERIGQAVGQPCLIADQLATMRGQAEQSPHGHTLRMEWRKSLRVAQ